MGLVHCGREWCREVEDVFAAYSCKRGEVYIVVLENIVEKVCYVPSSGIYCR